MTPFRISGLLACLLCCALAGPLRAQTFAPDFTLTDLQGNAHNLYSYLDSNKTVVLDFSATWCGPCWNYHNTHALRDLYQNHGPAGMSGVSATTTDDVMVLFIEADPSTPLGDLTGGGSSQGDWTADTPYPIINVTNSTVPNAYNVSYFPTILVVCPDRSYSESGQKSTNELYNVYSQACPRKSAGIDATVLGAENRPYGGCAQVPIPLYARLRSLGSDTLTQATLTVKDGNNTLLTHNWAGSLATFEMEEVYVGDVVLPSTKNLKFNVSTPQDVQGTNDVYAQQVTAATQAASANRMYVSLLTDNFPQETSWKILDEQGNTVQSHAYTAADKNKLRTHEVMLDTAQCYRFEISDTGGDGICCNQGQGYYKLLNSDGLMVMKLVTGQSAGNFTTKNDFFRTGTGLVVAGLEPAAQAGIQAYPNPAAQADGFVVALPEPLRHAGAHATLLGPLGNAVLHLPLPAAETHLPTASLPAGMYTLRVIASGTAYALRVVLQ